ncbi:MAG: peptidoglycan-binding domain-containing protein [Alphaproteobacteria bacterium]|nr:peptidoglycan-binding domain-containing protein [Alphaproteobacteria bacterium]
MGLALTLDASFVLAQTEDSQVEPQPASGEAPPKTDQAVRKPSYRVHKNKRKKHKAAKTKKSARATAMAKKQGMTVEEVRKFQREHGLKADGILGPKTLSALLKAKAEAVPKENPKILGVRTIPTIPQEYAPDPNPEVNQDQVPSLQGGSKIAFSRYGHLDVVDRGGDPDKRYALMLNGQQILEINSQPSIVGVSKTYEVGMEDAIVITAYNSKNPALCAYRNYVLVIGSGGGKLLDLKSCTRKYSASVNGSSLYIVFPDDEDNRAVGATWRLEGQKLTKL